MQEIRSVIALALLSAATALPAAAEDVAPSLPLRSALQTCFDLDEGLSRLRCYDDLLERPVKVVQVQPVVVPPPVPVVPKALTEAWNYLASPFAAGEGESIHVTLIERSSGRTLGQDDHAILGTPEGDAFDDLRQRADLVLALRSNEAIGEPVTLLIGCRANITEMRLVWDREIAPQVNEMRFYAGQSLEEDKGRQEPMRLRAENHVLEAPRGLEAISLIRDFVGGERMQAAIEAGSNPRSAFFDMQDLRAALPLQARFCSWSAIYE